MSSHTNHDPSRTYQVAVIGGGISGLAAAFYLQKRTRIAVTLFESSDRLGGVIQTDRQDGFLIEHSADSFIANEAIPWAKDFCRDVGLGDQVIPTQEKHRRAQIWFRGRMHPVPEGFHLMKPSSLWPIAKSSLLSPVGKIRLAYERCVPHRLEQGDESLASFATRRLGREAFQRLVQPLVSGIYTADPEKLSMQAALPQFVSMEKEHGSLIAAAMSQAREKSAGARYIQFWSLRHGLGSLVDTARDQLSAVKIRYNAPVTRLTKSGKDWSVSTHQSNEIYNAVILATPLSQSASIVHDADPDLADQLSQIEHASSAIVCVGYAREQFPRPLTAFGCVIPEIENARILAVSYSSMKFPERAPVGCELLRVFVGGALHPELTVLPDDELRQLVREELHQIIGVHGDPIFSKIARWPNTMPQYHLGHTQRVGQICGRVKRLSGIAIAGNGLHGVGLPQCIRSGIQAADSVSNLLEKGERN